MREQVEQIWKGQEADEEKVRLTAKIYFDYRIEQLPPDRRERTRQLIQTIRLSDVSRYSAQEGVQVIQSLKHLPVAFFQVAAHELEHFVQEGRLDSLDRLLTLLSPIPFPKGAIEQLREERAAFAASWDFLQLIPEPVRQAERQRAQGIRNRLRVGEEELKQFDWALWGLGNAHQTQSQFIEGYLRNNGYTLPYLISLHLGVKGSIYAMLSIALSATMK